MKPIEEKRKSYKRIFEMFMEGWLGSRKTTYVMSELGEVRLTANSRILFRND